MYQIRDLQFSDRLFADGVAFATKSEIRDQLVDYHLSDTFDNRDRNEIENMTLDDILDFGQWEIIEADSLGEKI